MVDTTGYLTRLGLAHPGPPSAAGLAAIHRAHVERIAYTTLDIQLGRPVGIEPDTAARHVVEVGRAGYCLHCNSALSALLQALGYRVRWHVGGVQRHVDPAPGMDFAPAAARPAHFAASHAWMSTAPGSGFVQVFTVVRRHAGGVDRLRGLQLQRVDARGSSERELDRSGDWFAALIDLFGLRLDDVDSGRRRALWRRVRRRHLQWLEAQA